MRLEKLVDAIAVVAVVVCGSSVAVASSTPQHAFSSASPNDVDPLAQGRIDAIVAEIMDQQYGNARNAVGQCWEYTYGAPDAETDYCMQPAKAEVVPTRDGYGLYLRTSNKLDAGDAFDAVSPGLMGAFEVAIDRNGQWRYVAKSPALPFGTMGYCGCDKAKFVQLGSDYYGWMFSSGGTWQGITVANHEIVAPRGDAFEDVSEVPEIRESGQDVSYAVEVMADRGDIFPLKVIRIVSGRRDGEMIVPFDKVRWAYRMPESF